MSNRPGNLRFGPGWPDAATGPSSGFEVAPLCGAMFRVRLWGCLAPEWCGNLSLGLSKSGIDIMRGFARKAGPGRWLAEFEVQPTAVVADVGAIDYLGLARDPSSGADTVPIVLDNYYLDGSPESGEALFLEVRGPDRVGFLGSLLKLMADLSLFPQEMTVETRGPSVFDRFHLKTPEGSLPSEGLRRALAEALDGLLRLSSRQGTSGDGREPLRPDLTLSLPHLVTD